MRRVWSRPSLFLKSLGFSKRRGGETRGCRTGAKGGQARWQFQSRDEAAREGHGTRAGRSPNPPAARAPSNSGNPAPKRKRRRRLARPARPRPQGFQAFSSPRGPLPRPEFDASADFGAMRISSSRRVGRDGQAPGAPEAGRHRGARVNAHLRQHPHRSSCRHNNRPPPASSAQPRDARATGPGARGKRPHPRRLGSGQPRTPAPTPLLPSTTQRRPLPPPSRKALAPRRLDCRINKAPEGTGVPPARAPAPCTCRGPPHLPSPGLRARAAASRLRCPAPRVQCSRGAGHPRRRQRAGGGEAGGSRGARGGRGARGRRRRWRGRREREQGGRRGGRRREARK